MNKLAVLKEMHYQEIMSCYCTFIWNKT
uniref:Uncharacterized protein n=1 Tax=Anguilla anguilla TaxID=7936 RepID=A0A0E9PG99_ANGAN